MELETLLAPLEENRPCGENIEYDFLFLSLEHSVIKTDEQQYGETIIPAVEPDWLQVKELSYKIFTKTKDLRVVIIIIMAWVNLYGVAGYQSGLQLLVSLLERFWNEIHPVLSDDDDEKVQRINILAALGDNYDIFRYVSQIQVVKYNGNVLTLKDICAILDGSIKTFSNAVCGKDDVERILVTEYQDLIKDVELITQYIDAFQEIIKDRLGESAVPEMVQLKRMFFMLKQVYLYNESDSGNLSDATVKLTKDKKLADQHDVDSIITKNDIRTYMQISKEYFSVNEPSHPAVLMIERVMSIIDLDFISIIDTLMPEETNKFKSFFGLKEVVSKNEDEK